jgi:large subunit ribosomal protein L22
MIQAHATAHYVRTSPQKAKMVLDLIRGRDVNRALATLRFARKAVARDIDKVLRSAIANAQQKEGFGGDVDRLYVATCYANQGPSMKRVRPAPMGRAFRIVKRTSHLTVEIAERTAPVAPGPATAASAEPAAARGKKAASRHRAASRGRTPTGARKTTRSRRRRGGTGKQKGGKT